MIYSNVKREIKTICKDNDVIKIKYKSSVDIFMLHLSYIVASVLTKNNVEQDKIVKITSEQITTQVCKGALEILEQLIEENISETTAIALSKSRKFDKKIKEKLINL
ncbi:MAG: hypothetical protein N4A63_02350 [Vallitalea sp.]|jgi:hypothetical protein|nr:hypothetical protein [Vallitalea sp.]